MMAATNILLFILAVIFNILVFSCICVSIKRGKRMKLLHLDNFFYMRLIRWLLILSAIFLFIECFGFLIHYSYYNPTRNINFNKMIERINKKLITFDPQNIYTSDIIIYFGFLLFELCSVGAYFVALHRFLLTNQQSNTSNYSQNMLHAICIICYILISLTVIIFSICHLFIILDAKLYYILLICFDIQLIISSIPVFKSLKKVIAISRDSAKSVRWSVTNVSPKKLLYKMSVKAVRMGMENLILNILLILDIVMNVYQIIQIETDQILNINNDHRQLHDDKQLINGIPSKIHYSHIIILYFIQLFIMLFTVDYSWVNKKYITIKKNRINFNNNNNNNNNDRTKTRSQRRYMHSRQNLSDFDYNNTVLNRVLPPNNISNQSTHTVKLKAAASDVILSQNTDTHHSENTESEYGDIENMSELQFLKGSKLDGGNNKNKKKDKLRSASFSTTVNNKKKLNKEFKSKTRSFEDSDLIKVSKHAHNTSRDSSKRYTIILYYIISIYVKITKKCVK